MSITYLALSFLWYSAQNFFLRYFIKLICLIFSHFYSLRKIDLSFKVYLLIYSYHKITCTCLKYTTYFSHIYTFLWNHHYNQESEHFCHCQSDNSWCQLISYPLPSPQVETDMSSVILDNFLHSKISYKWNKLVCTFVWIRLLPLSMIVGVHLLSCVRLFANSWTTAHQALLSSTFSWRLMKFTSIESVMFSHLILCHPLLLPSVFSSIRVFSNESGLFQLVGSSSQVAKLLELQLQQESGQWM